jgi:DNA repair exonuclease SbcCD ATPase subunit
VAYKTEIQLKVDGLTQIEKLEKTLTRVNALQTRINKRATSKFVDIGRLSSETKALTSFNRELEKNVTLRERAQKLGPSGGGGAGGGAGGRPGGGVNRLESLALGAGFPLLFGGGAGQVLGGIAGSFVGTGFGGQILGSAIGGAIEDFTSSAAQLGNALNEITPDMERLAEAIGAVGNEEGRRLELLEELQGETVAFNAAQKELAVLIGQGGINALKDLGSETVELSNQFNRFITIVQAGLAGLINSAGILSGLVGTVSRAVAARQAETSQDPRLVALRQERESLGRGPAAVGRELEIRREMIDVQLEINKGRTEEFKIQLQNLETDFKAKQAKIEQAKIDRENARIAREAHALRVTDLRVQQSGIQVQISQLANEEKIFQLRQQTAASTVELERARFDAQLSTLQLQEAGLQRELQGLEEKEIRFNRQRELINEIAQNRIEQAEIENKVAKLQNEQAVLQAEVAQQQIKFEVQRINLQLQMVRLKAEEIENDERRAAKLREIAATEQLTLSLTREMIAGGNKRLANAREIARQNNIVADNILKGKLQSIEAERVEARRAINAKELAKATGQAADEAARLNSNMSKGGSGGGGLGSKTTQTVSTRNKIDPDVYKGVMDRAPAFGYRNVYKLVEELDKAQERKNARAETEQFRQNLMPSASSFASSSSYAPRASSGGGGGTASVNIKTGPVLEFDGKRYMTMDDFERGVAKLASAQAQRARSFGARRYGGIS